MRSVLNPSRNMFEHIDSLPHRGPLNLAYSISPALCLEFGWYSDAATMVDNFHLYEGANYSSWLQPEAFAQLSPARGVCPTDVRRKPSGMNEGSTGDR